MDHIVNSISKAKRPYITHQDSERFITGITDGTVIGYKYFAFNGNYTMSFRVRGDGNGTLTRKSDNTVLIAVPLRPCP